MRKPASKPSDPWWGREEAVLQETEDFLDRVYQGSLSLMVSALTKKQALPQEEIDALYAMLQEMEENVMMEWIP